jgi:hypothetical protein
VSLTSNLDASASGVARHDQTLEGGADMISDFCSGRITGTRLHIEGMAPAYVWLQKRPFAVAGPVILGFTMNDNSTGVSARERRHT